MEKTNFVFSLKIIILEVKRLIESLISIMVHLFHRIQQTKSDELRSGRSSDTTTSEI